MANYGGRGYERRKEIAREKGFPSYDAYRNASKADREAATRALASRSPRYAKTGALALVVSPPARRRLHDLGGGRQLLRSMSNPELMAFLRRAAANDMRVSGVVNTDGGVVDLWKRGGIDPQFILDELEAAGSKDVRGWLSDYMGDEGGNEGGVSGAATGPISMVQLVSGDAQDVGAAA